MDWIDGERTVHCTFWVKRSHRLGNGLRQKSLCLSTDPLLAGPPPRHPPSITVRRVRLFRQLKPFFHPDKYHIPPSEMQTTDLNQIDFRGFFQSCTLDLLVSRIGEVYVTQSDAIATECNCWPAPIYTDTFLESATADVTATSLDIEASLFLANRFPTRDSVHAALRSINLARRSLYNTYPSTLERDAFSYICNRGWSMNEYAVKFRPSTSSAPEAPSHTIQVVPPPPLPPHTEQPSPEQHINAPPTGTTTPTPQQQHGPSIPPLLTRYEHDPIGLEASSNNPHLYLQRQRADLNTLAHSPLAAFDHIPLIQCVGGNDSHFAGFTHIPTSLQGKHAEGFFHVCLILLETSHLAFYTPRVPTLSEDASDIQLERAIKLWFLFGPLIYRTSPISPASMVKKIVQQRLDHLLNSRHEQLIAAYESGLVSKKETVGTH